MTKTIKRVISVLLAIVLVAGTFAGCGKSKDEPPIAATAVKYTKSGQYTTTVSSKKFDLSGITADNIEVRYANQNDALTVDNFANQIAMTATAEAETDATESKEKINLDKLYPLTAKVKSVKTNDKKGYDITFTDENAADYATKDYIITFEGTEDTANVAVDFPEITLTPDVEFVTPSQKDIKLTLSISGSEFEGKITEADITIGDSFEKMKKEVISSSANNLTLELKGDIMKNEAGAYQWGTVGVKPSAIKDGYEDVTAKTEIKLDAVYLDTSSMKYADGKLITDLKAYGLVNVSKLTKDNVKLEGVTTEAVEKIDDNTARITFSAKKINSINDFADLVSGKAFELGDYKTELGLSQASVYPIFDYIEEDGKNLRLTLKLHAGNGTFGKNLKVDSITFADDFEGAKIESVKVDSETIATLIISVPANGATTENFELNGTVQLAAGTLVNEWGENASKEVNYTRTYSGESLGREVSLNGDTLLEIQKYTRGLNTVIGKVCYYGGIAGQVYSIGKTVLEAAGVLQSDQAKIMEQFAVVNKKLDTVINNQYVIMGQLDKIEGQAAENANESYRENIKELKRNVGIMEDLIKKGALKMALEKAKAEGKIDKMPRADEYENYTEYLPDVSKMSDAELEAYNNELMDYIEDEWTERHNTTFNDFASAYELMKTALGRVADKLSENDTTNPIVRYDSLCAKKYNFDSQCYEFRCQQRNVALDLMSRAMMVIFMREKVMSDTKDTTFVHYIKSVEPAANWVNNSYNDIGHPAQDLEIESDYISDIMIAGMNTDNSDDVKKLLINNGYTPYEADLNQGTNGEKIYLGYKTTKNRNEAIKGFTYATSKADTTQAGDKTYTLCPFVGDEKFKSSKGDLNCGATYKEKYYAPGSTTRVFYKVTSAPSLYLYYTKDGDEQDAVNNIYFDGNEKNSLVNANKGISSSSYIYMHYGFTIEVIKGVQAYPHPEKVKTGVTYIREFAVSGDSNAEAARNALKSQGYTVYEKDLNETAGGYFVYLGYKTTKDYKLAVKNVWVETRAFLEPNPTSTNSLVPVYGNQSFIDSHGDLNYDAGGSYLYLNQDWTPIANNRGKAISSFWINGTKPETNKGVSTDLNYGAGGSYLYLHYEYSDDETETGKILQGDSEYYPYSYVLGSKVATGKYTKYVSNEDFGGAIKKADGGFRNWTDNEINEFISRMGDKTWDEELKSAGLTEISDTLAVNISWDGTTIYGTTIPKGSNKTHEALSNDSKTQLPYSTTYTFLKLYN